MEADFKANVLNLSPIIDIAGGAFAALDQMSDVLAIPGAVNSSQGTAIITSLSGVDKAKIECNFDILFFSEVPTVISTKNAILDISDSEMVNKFLGRISAESYVTNNNNSDFTVGAGACGLKIKGNPEGKIYAILQARSNASGAYLTTTDLTCKLGIDQD